MHVVLDNLSAHSAPQITKWLAHRDRRRWHLHFTPTSSSWTNLVERWFKELTDKRLRRGRFTSVADLTGAITIWAEHWNTDPKPFIWKATAEEIIAKVQRGRETLRQIKSTTDHRTPMRPFAACENALYDARPLACGDAGGRYWDRTSDLFRVREARYRCANRPRCSEVETGFEPV